MDEPIGERLIADDFNPAHPRRRKPIHITHGGVFSCRHESSPDTRPQGKLTGP